MFKISDCKLRLRISQYDFSHYSKLVHTITHEIDSRTEGIIEFSGCKWLYQIKATEIAGHSNGYDILMRVQLTKGNIDQCNVAVECLFDDWSANNYVLMPAAVYNGNRFESRRIAYSPKLLDPRDIGPYKDPIITDVPKLNIHDGPSFIHDRSGAMSTPSMGFFSPAQNKGFWMLTPQRTTLGDYGYKITENRNRTIAAFSVSAPVVREEYKYRITDNQYPSDDRAPDWKTGDSVDIQLQLYFFNAPRLQYLFDHWNTIRYNLIPKPKPIKPLSFSSTFVFQENKFNSQNWVESHGYYSVGMREMFLQDWQIGWTGGMITTYPLLLDGSIKSKERVIRNFDFLFPEGISPSGFFYDCGESKAGVFHWYGGDIRKPHTSNWHLIRKSGDGLYYILKQLWLMKKTEIEIKDSWEKGILIVANAFVKLWKHYGQTGNFVDSNSGEIIAGGSTSAGIAPAGLAYASIYFSNPEYMQVAQDMAHYFYEKYIRKGLTMGGVGDAMQNPDSESAYGVLESFAVLYEQTGKKEWLEKAQEMASQFFTWIIGYNYEFPTNSTLGKIGIQTHGAVFANTQNKHGAPGICTHSGAALLRLFRATGKIIYLETLRDIARFIPQMFSHPHQSIPGMKPGWITERVSTTDWFEGIGELMYGSTWAETSLMLTYAEIPGIYVVPDKEFVFAIDNLETEIVTDKDTKSSLRITNKSSETVRVKVFIESGLQQSLPLGENYLLQAKKLTLKPGEVGYCFLES